VLDTINSYLVSLGFSVDKSSYDAATKSMDNVEKGVSKFAGSAVTKFAVAGAAVTSFVAASVFGIAKFVDGLGKASIENEKLARQMWISEQSAMAFNSTLKAMGVSLQDLYLSPTLMSQFRQLRSEAVDLQAPSDYKDQMRTIQSISFEFKRMKLEATYALQWIGYYFIKYMSGPLNDIKKKLGDLNGTIVKTMPSWTKVIAQVMSGFAQMGITTVRAFKDIVHVFDEIGQGIPKNLKLIASAASAVGMIIATGPVGIISAILLGAILLLNDFYTYLDGGEAAFGPFWEKLISFKESLDVSGQLESLKESFTGVFDAASDVLDVLGKILMDITGSDSIGEALKKIGGFTLDALIIALQTVDKLLNGIKDSLNLIRSTYDLGAANDLIKRGKESSQRLKKETGSTSDLEAIFGHGILDGPFSSSFNDRSNVTNGLLAEFFSNINLSNIFGSSSEKAPSYIYPSSAPQTNNSRVTLSQTNNIYGSDANATAGAAQDNWYSFYIRNNRGVIR
jgi:hypothetical protein